MTPRKKVIDHFPPEWQSALRFAAQIHHQKMEDMAGAAYLYLESGKTIAQFQSKIRREIKPKFANDKLQAIAREWGIIYHNSGDPLESLIKNEDDLAKAKKADEINFGEFDSARLAAGLGISRRMAQIKIRKRKREIEDKIKVTCLGILGPAET